MAASLPSARARQLHSEIENIIQSLTHEEKVVLAETKMRECLEQCVMLLHAQVQDELSAESNSSSK